MENARLFARYLSCADRAVFFTGAGMSTASGLPDFRSSRGLWRQFDPSRLASVTAMDGDPEKFQAFYRMRMEALSKALPNRGHEILARWEEEGLVRGTITQNVDGLHQEAGSRNVYELHGNLRHVFCRKCRRMSSPAEFLQRGDCPECGDRLRPGVVLFGEGLPWEVLENAEEMTRGCDLFVVLGSSLTVAPANGFPQLARSCGARLVIVNRGETSMDHHADIRIEGAVEEILPEVDALLEGHRS